MSPERRGGAGKYRSRGGSRNKIIGEDSGENDGRSYDGRSCDARRREIVRLSDNWLHRACRVFDPLLLLKALCVLEVEAFSHTTLNSSAVDDILLSKIEYRERCVGALVVESGFTDAL